MHIKTLTIQGFKSYRDQVAIPSFSPGHNVVVGRNGSGKSNFFLAIRFVLSDAYTAMSREERQGLLHEGTSNQTTMSAYVEIVFDNEDGRFPTGNKELILRRTIGQKKDEYSLDKKSASKAEVMNLLESAGFSRSNPYYIVPQGRITTLTNMKEGERLNLLKEVAGTKVYEQRRQESLKIMDETQAKRDKISDSMEKIDERLTELQEEQQELREFQTKDDERRCLEYALYQRELDEVEKTLEQTEEDKRRDVDDSNTKREQFNKREGQIKDLQTKLTEDKHSLEALTLESAQSASEMTDLIKSKTELECVIEDAEQAGQDGEARKTSMEDELGEIEDRINEITEELMSLDPDLEDKTKEVKELKQRIDIAQGKLDALYSKQGRSNKFKTQAERDTYLKKEITSIKSAQSEQKTTIKSLGNDIKTAEAELDEVKARGTALEEEAETARTSLGTMTSQREKLKKDLDEKIEQRKDLWREDGKLAQNVASAKNEKTNADRALNGMMDKDTQNGLIAVNRIANQLGIQGVYGPLYSLFDVEEKYKVAVEVTGGTSLFHVVVDNDETVTKILAEMNKQKSGRVTFMPLNRLRTNTEGGRMPNAIDAIPLLSKINMHGAHLKMAFEQVFGRTIVCPDLSTAAAYTRSHGINAITLDGDRVDRKGSLTGGYHDVRRSRIDAVKSVKTWTSKLEADIARQAEVKQGITQLDQQINQIQGNIQKLESSRKSAIDASQRTVSQISWVKKEQDQLNQRLDQLEASLADAQRDAQQLTTKLEAYEVELKTAMRQTLTNEEIKAMESLTKQIDQDNTAFVEKSQERSELSSKKNLLDIELNDDLGRRKLELRSKIDSIGMDVSTESQSGDLAARRQELENLEGTIADLQATIEETQSNIDSIQKKINDAIASLDEHQAAQLENSRGILKTQKAAERYLTKRQTLTTRRDECNKSIRDLGVLPEKAFDKKNLSRNSDKILKNLHKVNESLKSYSHVNKKAVEQFASFNKQRATLTTRREELEASSESIQELIDNLDQRKDEAIERTFKQVSKNFAEVFERLVPAGKGRFKMQRRVDQDDEDEDMEDHDRRHSTVDSYTGVAIEVSFNSKLDEGQRVQQLSGGQKSLVALATIFAIQRTDSSPFILLDEVDANLDAAYRGKVAEMIHELSQEGLQVIATTFRPELVAQADHAYGVIFNNQKISRIEKITLEEAQGFIDASA